MDRTPLPVAVVGAGPPGLAAAAELAELYERGLPFVVLERGGHAGSAVRGWGHVRLFSPWRHNVALPARRLLDRAGWTAPDDDALPTGAEFRADYLGPLADLPEIRPHVRYHSTVRSIGRLGLASAPRDAPTLPSSCGSPAARNCSHARCSTRPAPSAHRIPLAATGCRRLARGGPGRPGSAHQLADFTERNFGTG